MKKIVLVAAAAAVSLGLAACSKSEEANTTSANEIVSNEAIPADENLSAVDESTLGNNSADAVLPADNGTEASNVSANAL